MEKRKESDQLSEKKSKELSQSKSALKYLILIYLKFCLCTLFILKTQEAGAPSKNIHFNFGDTEKSCILSTRTGRGMEMRQVVGEGEVRYSFSPFTVLAQRKHP